MKNSQDLHLKNKNVLLATTIAIILSILVLIFVPGQVNKFTFIMPIFAGFIFYLILSSSEEEK